MVTEWAQFAKDIAKIQQSGAEGYKGIIIDPAPGYLFYLKSLRWGMGSAMLCLSLLGMAYTFIRRPREASLLAVLPLVLYLFLGRQLMFFSRFIIPAIPFLLIFCAFLLTDATERLLGNRPRVHTAALGLLCLIVSIESVVADVRADVIFTLSDTRTLAREWIERNAPAGARITRESNGPKLPGEDPPSPHSDKGYTVELIKGREIGEKSIAEYSAAFDYVVINSYQYDLTLDDPEQARQNQDIYDALDAIGAVAEFVPYQEGKKPPFVFDQIYGPITHLSRFERPGPEVKIYRLN